MHEAGFKVVGISDIHGGIHDPRASTSRRAEASAGALESFEEYPGAEQVSNQELLELECDVLVPAATENQITIAER